MDNVGANVIGHVEGLDILQHVFPFLQLSGLWGAHNIMNDQECQHVKDGMHCLSALELGGVVACICAVRTQERFKQNLFRKERKLMTFAITRDQPFMVQELFGFMLQ